MYIVEFLLLIHYYIHNIKLYTEMILSKYLKI